jgi:hypothetical protein
MFVFAGVEPFRVNIILDGKEDEQFSTIKYLSSEISFISNRDVEWYLTGSVSSWYSR